MDQKKINAATLAHDGLVGQGLEAVTLIEVVKRLEVEEGFSEFPYDDATGLRINFSTVCKGYPTVGHGFNLAAGMSREEAKLLVVYRVQFLARELGKLSWFNALPQSHRNVMVLMAYNLGLPGLLKFKKMIAALGLKQFATAATEIRNSAAFRQLPGRYGQYADEIENGA